MLTRSSGKTSQGDINQTVITKKVSIKYISGRFHKRSMWNVYSKDNFVSVSYIRGGGLFCEYCRICCPCNTARNDCHRSLQVTGGTKYNCLLYTSLTSALVSATHAIFHCDLIPACHRAIYCGTGRAPWTYPRSSHQELSSLNISNYAMAYRSHFLTADKFVYTNFKNDLQKLERFRLLHIREENTFVFNFQITYMFPGYTSYRGWITQSLKKRDELPDKAARREQSYMSDILYHARSRHSH